MEILRTNSICHIGQCDPLRILVIYWFITKAFFLIQLASLATFHSLKISKAQMRLNLSEVTIGAGTWGHRQKSIHFASAESRELS